MHNAHSPFETDSSHCTPQTQMIARPRIAHIGAVSFLICCKEAATRCDATRSASRHRATPKTRRQWRTIRPADGIDTALCCALESRQLIAGLLNTGGLRAVRSPVPEGTPERKSRRPPLISSSECLPFRYDSIRSESPISRCHEMCSQDVLLEAPVHFTSHHITSRAASLALQVTAKLLTDELQIRRKSIFSELLIHSFLSPDTHR